MILLFSAHYFETIEVKFKVCLLTELMSSRIFWFLHQMMKVCFPAFLDNNCCSVGSTAAEAFSRHLQLLLGSLADVLDDLAEHEDQERNAETDENDHEKVSTGVVFFHNFNLFHQIFFSFHNVCWLLQDRRISDEDDSMKIHFQVINTLKGQNALHISLIQKLINFKDRPKWKYASNVVFNNYELLNVRNFCNFPA